MTTEDKQLLLKDLCARLPYVVKCRLSVKGADVSITEKLNLGGLEHFIYGTMDVLPYLRPMSSMTEEEQKEYNATMRQEYREAYPYSIVDTHYYEQFITYKTFDWLNSHHFDFRGLIKKGLALEAKDGMYKTK